MNNMPGFTAEASLDAATSFYQSRATQPGGGSHRIVSQGLVAASANLVFPASCCETRCKRSEDGPWYECDCVRECWE